MRKHDEEYRDDGHTIVDMGELPERSFFGLQRLKRQDVYQDAQGNLRRKRTFSSLELLLFAVITLLVLAGVALLLVRLFA